MLFGTAKNPKGPKGKWEPSLFNLSGNKLFLTLPPCNMIASHGKFPQPCDIDIYNCEYDLPDEENSGTPPFRDIAWTDWEFNGLFDGYGGYGTLELFIKVCQFDEFSSLFRPFRREQSIERYIYTRHAPFGKPRSKRLNYSLLKESDNVWSCFEHGNKNLICCTPISDRHMLQIHFNVGVHREKSRVAEAANALAKKIMENVKLELSEDALRSKKEAEANYPWEQLTPNLPPYEFEYLKPIGEYDFIRMASKEKNHDQDIPHSVYIARGNELEAEHKKEQAALRQRVLDSHLRFEELEEQAEINYKNNQKQ